MISLISCIRLAGILHLILAAANLLLPKKLQYQENLSKVSTIVKQIFVIHSIFIVLVLLIFSGASLLFADELAHGSPLGRFLAISIGIFWSLRVPIQLFYYDPEIKKQNPVVNFIFTSGFIFMAGVYDLAALRMF